MYKNTFPLPPVRVEKHVLKCSKYGKDIIYDSVGGKVTIYSYSHVPDFTPQLNRCICYRTPYEYCLMTSKLEAQLSTIRKLLETHRRMSFGD